MHPDHIAKRTADVYHGGPIYSASANGFSAIGTGAAISKSAEISALEAIGNRVQNLAVRLDDTNRHTLAFIERVSGSEPSRPDTVSNALDGGSIMPSLATIDALLSMLEAHVHEADRLSSKLARIG